MVYIAIRSFQGANEWCWAKQPAIAEVLSTGRAAISRAVKVLESEGWIEREGGKMRCLVPAGSVDETSTSVDETSTTAEGNVDETSRHVDETSRHVDETSSPSKSQQLKPTVKANNTHTSSEHQENSPSFADLKSWWNDLAGELDLPSVIAKNDKRLAGVRKRGAEIWDHRREIRQQIMRSSFLRGEGDSNWRVNFDFLLCTSGGYTKILEGQYRDTSHEQKSSRKSASAQLERNPAADLQRNRALTYAALGLEPPGVGGAGDSPRRSGGGQLPDRSDRDGPA